MAAIAFDNSYSALGSAFYTRVEPEPVSDPRLLFFNDDLAAMLGIQAGSLDIAEKAAVFSGNRIPDGAEPLAMVYSGHQFGAFNPRLGDGRAILLGEVVAGGERFDIQLKGSGRTPYSRNGDGRATVGAVLRESILSEAMANLGVPTTRSLAVVSTGDLIRREGWLPGGVITRVSRSFVRIGTFEYFASIGDHDAMKKLANYVIDRIYPDLRDAGNPYEALLAQVIERQARLIAHWMRIGFIHGVMNTDNVSIAGETIDYGPCAFMDGFDHDQVFSSIDRQGRYAYGNQPSIGQWNLVRFAETLLPLLMQGDDTRAAVAAAERLLNEFRDIYHQAWFDGMREKLGLVTQARDDARLIDDFLDLLDRDTADFTLAFRRLSSLGLEPSARDAEMKALFHRVPDLEAWLARWRQRLRDENSRDAERQQRMQRVNPLYIPRNHLVEAVIRAAEDHGDMQPFHQLGEVLQNPFEERPEWSEYARPPKPEEQVLQTYCGT
ncbi:MAG TPA: YdiU family protein [Gammaproteobacteria bacterium]|nr:YdiU family protein [Gammaproteobacteria bacterium]